MGLSVTHAKSNKSSVSKYPGQVILWDGKVRAMSWEGLESRRRAGNLGEVKEKRHMQGRVVT